MKKINTKKLNDFLKVAISKYPHPSTQGKDIKIKYISQVHNRPPVFALFCNHPKLVTRTYKRYLLNSLREHFKYLGVTVKLSFRQK